MFRNSLIWALLLLLWLSGPAMAQDAAEDASKAAEDAKASAEKAQSAAESTAQEIQELRDELKKVQDALAEAQAQATTQQSTLKDQQKTIAGQEKDLQNKEDEIAKAKAAREATQKQVDQLNTLVLSLNNRLQALESQAPADSVSQALDERMKRLEGTVSQLPESPDIVTEGTDFPGSMTIPGTDAAFKFGGRVRMSIVNNLDAMGVDDRFITASIPPAGSPGAAKGPRIDLSVRATRLNFEMRTPTPSGHLRAFVEGDFAGDGNTFRLRHAYGQYRRSLAGQTWTTFTDPLAAPTDIDFEGVNAMNNTRQPQIRVTTSFWEEWTTSLAIETPVPEVTGAVGVSQVPDIVLAARRKTARWHAHLSTVFRQIRAQPQEGVEDIKSEPGWGVSLSGHAKFRVLNEDDKIMFQATVGQAVGRYINDLNTLGGQDAVFDTTTQTLEVLPARGFYIGYEHSWTEKWASSLIWGIVKVDNLGIQPGFAYRRTDRTSLNLVFSPISFLSIGFEFLHGARHNFDGSYGVANQWQFASTYLF